MEHIRNFYEGYGDMPPWGQGPEQGRIRREGVQYMETNFPLMDRFEACIVEIVYPNLLDYDERDMKNTIFAEEGVEEREKMYLLRGKLEPGSGGARVLKQKQILASILGNVRSTSEISSIKDLSNVDLVNKVAFGVALLLIFTAIACFLRRNRKSVEKTN